MEFEIVRTEKTYVGVVPGVLCAWQFEVIKNGKVGFFSNRYFEGTPEECYENESCYEDMFEAFNAEPTGRVVFNGYWEGYYDFDEREECVRPATKTEEAIEKYLVH